MPIDVTKLAINFTIFSLVLIFSLIFVFRLKNVSKGYKAFFILYIIFWIPLKLLRDYSSIAQKSIDPSMIPLVLSIYGFVGMLIRPLSDFLSLRLKNRKIILYTAIGIGIVSFLPMAIVPNTATNTLQSIGVGVGASMIGTYELMFKEQYTSNKSFLTVSILAFPPLIADFFAAPIQSLISNFASDAAGKIMISKLSYLWVVGILIYAIAFVFLFFIKEDRTLVGSLKNNQINSEKKTHNILFISMICLIGFLISFLKFSNSGSIATLNLDLMANKNIDTNELKAYISTVFSLFQLFGTIIVGNVLIKKLSKLTCFSIGILFWIVYEFIVLFNSNPYLYFAAASLNGFAYGLLYNLILAYVLSLNFKKIKMTPMGVYQCILSFGIATSSFFTSFLKTNMNASYQTSNTIINSVLIVAMVILELIFVSVFFLDWKIFNIKIKGDSFKEKLNFVLLNN